MNDILPKENQWRPDKTILYSYYQNNLLLFEKTLLDKIIVSENSIIKDYINLDCT